MGLAAAKLGGHIEHRRGFGLDPRQAAHDLGRQRGQILGHVGALEELFGVLINVRGAACLHLIQMHGELGGVQRPAFTQVFAGKYNLIPRF